MEDEVRFVLCNSNQYKNALKDKNALYFVIDSGVGIAIYKLSVLVARNVQVATTLEPGIVILTDDIAHNITSDVRAGMAVTPKAVYDFLKNIDAMRFMGTVGTGGTIINLPAYGYDAGDVYKVAVAGTYAGQQCEVGDMIIAINDGPDTGLEVIDRDWAVIQANIDGAVTGPVSATNLHVAVFDGTTGKVIKDGGYALSQFVTTHQDIVDDGIKAAVTVDTLNRYEKTINRYGVCSVAAGIANKTATIAAGVISTYTIGLRVTVNFEYNNTAESPTLNINNLGAKNIFVEGAQITTGDNKALLCGVCDFVYDGTQFNLVGSHMPPVWGTL